MANILIVDDNADDRLLMRTVLEAQGHDIREALNGAEALRLAREFAPDLAISDILMPVMDGYALCREWQRDPVLRHVPFVHCSANYVQPSDVALARDVGAVEFLHKPVDPAQIRALVSEVFKKFPTTGATARMSKLDEESFLARHTTALANQMADKVRELENVNQRLADRERAFRQLFRESPVPIWVLDVETLGFLAVNNAVVSKYGWSKEEFLTMSVRDIRPAEDVPLVKETIAAIRKGSRDLVTQGIWRHKLRDGTLIEVEIFARPMEFNGREAIMSLIIDVSEQQRARRDLGRQMQMLDAALHATVETVMKIGELRDPYTAGHARRVGELAVAIGRELGLDEQALRGLEIMGQLHDVGKITVPTELLVKPGKLSRVEFEMIKEHPQQGYEILQKLTFPWPVAEAAWQHHERFDGSGYPQGPKGDAIILEARILAVADVVEAMSSHRPYRAALGVETALDEVARNTGRLYCERAAGACLRLFREKRFAFSD